MNSNCLNVISSLCQCSPSCALFAASKIRCSPPTHQYNFLRFGSLVAGTHAETTAHVVTANDAVEPQVRSESVISHLNATTYTSTQGAVNMEFSTSNGDSMEDSRREHITTTTKDHEQSESSEVVENPSISTSDTTTDWENTYRGKDENSNSESSELCCSTSSEEDPTSSEEQKEDFVKIARADEGQVSWIVAESASKPL